MSARRKIAAALLRTLAWHFDPPTPRKNAEAVIAATLAIPRSVNRFTERKHFSNRMADGSHISMPAVRVAAEFEAREPGLYTGNDEMVAAIGRYRAGGGL